MAKESIKTVIEKQGGKVEKILAPLDNQLESIEKIKDKIIKSIKEAEPPFTFLFNGHGLEEALTLYSSEDVDPESLKGKQAEKIKNAINVFLLDLKKALEYRQEKFGHLMKDPEKKDIFINFSCMSSNFARNILEAFEESEIDAIFLGEAEYGQYGFTEYRSQYNEELLNLLLDGELASLLDYFFRYDSLNSNSNPVVYIKDEDNKVMQLSSFVGKKEGMAA